MSIEKLREQLKNVHLTCGEIYDDKFQSLIDSKKGQLDEEAFEALKAIKPGYAFQATIVLKDDFELVNAALIHAGSPSVPISAGYNHLVNVLRAILPYSALPTFDSYIKGESYIYPQPIPHRWNPVLLVITLYGTPEYGYIVAALSCL